MKNIFLISIFTISLIAGCSEKNDDYKSESIVNPKAEADPNDYNDLFYLEALVQSKLKVFDSFTAESNRMYSYIGYVGQYIENFYSSIEVVGEGINEDLIRQMLSSYTAPIYSEKFYLKLDPATMLKFDDYQFIFSMYSMSFGILTNELIKKSIKVKINPIDARFGEDVAIQEIKEELKSRKPSEILICHRLGMLAAKDEIAGLEIDTYFEMCNFNSLDKNKLVSFLESRRD